MGLKMNNLPEITKSFFKPVETNEVEALFLSHRRDIYEAKNVADIVLGNNISPFFESSSDHQLRIADIESVFDIDRATAYIHAQYWSKALKLTDVIENMPANRKSEWNDQIREMKTPPFTKEAVYETLKQHLADRPKYLAERVDGIFKKLSGEHVTNRPEGFYKRMIYANVYDDWGHSNYEKSAIIQDLRIIANKFQGREEIVDTRKILDACRRNTGQWMEIDGGLLRIKAFLKGTCHIELDEKVSWELNQCLHFLYPAAIPNKRREVKKAKQVKKYTYLNKFIAPQILNILAESRWQDVYTVELPVNYGGNHVGDILESIGGQKTKAKKRGFSAGRTIEVTQYVFDYMAREVVDEIITSGQLPEQVSYQYYPTPKELAGAVSNMLQAKPEHSCLEPSAGQGALAEHLPKGSKCLELSKLHCEILAAKGFDAEQCDFLEHRQTYDRILMNPPFSEGRAKAHVEHAMSLLNKGGRCVAIVPSSHRNKFDKDGFQVSYSENIENAFADASVSVIFAIIDKE